MNNDLKPANPVSRYYSSRYTPTQRVGDTQIEMVEAADYDSLNERYNRALARITELLHALRPNK